MALPQSIRKCWHDKSDLSIYDATFWMLFESDPEQHTYRCERDSEFANHYYEHPNGQEALYEKSEVILSAIRAKIIEITKEHQNGNFLDITKTYIKKSDWISWCQEKGYTELSNLFTQETNEPTLTSPEARTVSVLRIILPTPILQTSTAATLKSWEIIDPKDPLAVQAWYTPARYFARELIKDDITLLNKRTSLAKKVAQSLKGVGILKRGNKFPLDPGTILKAFSNVNFS